MNHAPRICNRCICEMKYVTPEPVTWVPGYCDICSEHPEDLRPHTIPASKAIPSPYEGMALVRYVIMAFGCSFGAVVFWLVSQRFGFWG